MQPTTTLSFIFPNGTDDFFVGYAASAYVPVPAHGDLVGAKSEAFKVVAKVWNYDSASNLTIDITCQ